MKSLRCGLTAIAIALSSTPVTAATVNEDTEINDIAHGMTASDTAVACQLRTSEWRKSVLMGYVFVARLAVVDGHPNLSDSQIDARATKMFQTAKVKAALDAKFAAPTLTECDALNASHDMKEMDAAAKMGILFKELNK